jgi:acetolactate synthase I/II/III large subunit
MQQTTRRTRRQMADDLVSAWRKVGTSLVFGVPGGGSNLDVVGAAQACGMRFVLAHTENAAAIMAGVVGELTGAPGACVVTRGPGVTSAANGVAQALLDRQPLIFVTDCVADEDYLRISHQRLNQVGLMMPLTLGSYTYGSDESDVPRLAVGRALVGQPGPVHIDFDASADSQEPDPGPPLPSRILPPDDIRPLLAASRRAVFVVGVGALYQGTVAAQRVAATLHHIGLTHHTPMLTTYKARGVVADSAPWCAGVATGATIESPVLHAADLIIGVGLDPVEFIPADWPYTALILALDPWAIDSSSYLVNPEPDLPLDQSSADTSPYFPGRVRAGRFGDLVTSLEEVAGQLSTTWEKDAGWKFRQQSLKELDTAVPRVVGKLSPLNVVRSTRSIAPAGTIATVDAGAHMLLAVPFWEVDQPGELLISSGLATMGFALPAAIAAALVHPDRAVVCFTGDGGLGMVMAELETVVRLGLKVIVVVFNDATLSLIAAKQHPTDHGGIDAVRYRPIDFAAVARGVGMNAELVTSTGGLEDALRRAFAATGPTLLDVTVDPSSYPAVLDAVRGPRQ